MGLEKSFMVFIITEILWAGCNVQIFARREANAPSSLQFCSPEVSLADSGIYRHIFCACTSLHTCVHTSVCVHTLTYSMCFMHHTCITQKDNFLLFSLHGLGHLWMSGYTKQPPSFSRAQNPMGP